MSSPGFIYFQGEIKPSDQCALSPMDHAARYGCGLFETFLFQGNEIPNQSDRYTRIQNALTWLGINPDRLSLWRGLTPSDFTGVKKVLTDLLRAHQVSEGIVRYSIYPGPSRQGLSDLSYDHPVEMIDLRPPGIPIGAPKKLCLLKTVHAWERPPFKSTGNYLLTLKGLRELKEFPVPHVSEGLLLTRGGTLTEGLFSNLFAILPNQSLWTPIENGYILPGVIRKQILDFSKKQGIPLSCSEESPEFLRNAAGVFTTNSGSGLSPVTHIFQNHEELLWQGETTKNALWETLQCCQLQGKRVE